jgi:glycine cleavage system aminomethyltransferase T
LPIGSAVHERTFPLCESLNYREWSGYYAVSAYEAHHEHEYNAIRNAAALIDISPLFKYRLSGKDATRLVDRVVTRDMRKVSVGSVIYTPWCDERGKTIDDGTVARLSENVYRWTAADPSLRWFQQNALGLDVQIEDISEKVSALALQGPTSGRMLKAIAEADIENLKYFKVTTGKIAGVPVEISRTGYTGDLGYEIWVAPEYQRALFDLLWDAGRPHGMALFGFRALMSLRMEKMFGTWFREFRPIYTPLEANLHRYLKLDHDFIGRDALEAEMARGPERSLVYLDVEPDPDEPADVIGDEPVWHDDRVVGWVTSGGYAHYSQRSLALGYVPAALAHSDGAGDGHGEAPAFEIEIIGHRRPARLLTEPVFDPTGLRMRA